MDNYDVIIVGAGPAGIFAALEMIERAPSATILIVEKGKDLGERSCPMSTRGVSCAACPECSIVSGWGGAGAFSDGKLNLSTEVGGFLMRYLNEDDLVDLVSYVDGVYMKYGAPDELFGGDSAKIAEITRQANLNDLEFIPTQGSGILGRTGVRRCLPAWRMRSGGGLISFSMLRSRISCSVTTTSRVCAWPMAQSMGPGTWCSPRAARALNGLNP